MTQNGFKIPNTLHFNNYKSKYNATLSQYIDNKIARDSIENNQEFKPLVFTILDCSLSLNQIEIKDFNQQYTDEPDYDPP